MKAFFASWWFRIPFAYWLLGILLYPPAYDISPFVGQEIVFGGMSDGDPLDRRGFIRERVWAWTFIGDDWAGTMLIDWGTILWQFCILVTLVAIVRWVAGRIAGRLRSTRSTN